MEVAAEHRDVSLPAPGASAGAHQRPRGSRGRRRRRGRRAIGDATPAVVVVLPASTRAGARYCQKQ